MAASDSASSVDIHRGQHSGESFNSLVISGTCFACLPRLWRVVDHTVRPNAGFYKSPELNCILGLGQQGFFLRCGFNGFCVLVVST